MFFNLAWRNSKRNRSENLIYFLTMVTAVATFYIVLSLGSQDVMRFLEEIESDAVNRLLTMLMPTVYLFSLLFVFFLVIFANKYQLECRSRELGLYLMFGMTKRHLFIQIMAEGLITSLLALLGGTDLRRLFIRGNQPCYGTACRSRHNCTSVKFFCERCSLDNAWISNDSSCRVVHPLWKTIQQRNPPTPLWRNGEETASWKNEWELIFPHSRSGSFDACILGNPKVFHGCWRYDDNCCRDIRYCGNNAFYPWACRLAERSGGFCETQHNTRSIYFHSAGSYTKI